MRFRELRRNSGYFYVTGGEPLVNTGPESELTLNFKLTYLITKIFVCVYV